jgi:hypothetical protein
MEHFYMNVGEDWFDFQDIYSKMVDNFTGGSHFVEVGSWKGRSASYLAVEIINSDKTIKFDCVDTWKGSIEHIIPTSPFFQSELLRNEDWLYNEFMNNVQPVQSVINPIRTTSLKAATLYSDESLDFVYIDASHEYEDVIKDLHAWYPKIKKGGYIGGHDYHFYPGVRRAVNEFFETKPEIIRNSYLHQKI